MEEYKTALINNHSEFGAYIRNADLRQNQPEWIHNTESNAHNIVEHERDALALALRITSIDPSPLSRWYPRPQPEPFLSGIDHAVLTEDQLIGNDMAVFGDWTYRETKGLIATFSNMKGRQLTVLNVNRTNLETTLGADLIYYNKEYNAFTIVQYKRMRPQKSAVSDSAATYYPNSDRNLKKQLKRMARLEKVPPGANLSSADYRLGSRFCYIKVCKPFYEFSSAKPSAGMYFDMELWNLMERECASNQENFVVRYEPQIRYLTNTTFASMVGDGWIGSRNLGSTQIAAYIESSLSGCRSVTLTLSHEAS